MASNLSPSEIFQLKKTVLKASSWGRTEEIRGALSGLDPELVKEVVRYYSPDSPLFMAPLHAAALRGSLDVVKLLVEDFSADLDQKHVMRNSGLSETPLMYAIMMGNFDVVKFLVEKGCNVNLINCNGKSALFMAIEGGKVKIAKYLVDNGALLDIASRPGTTCLMRACRIPGADMVQYLLERGADPNGMKKNKRTALHVATVYENFDAIQCLLSHGAVMPKDENGRTPLMIAFLGSCTHIVDLFLNSPALTREEKIDSLEVMGAMTAGRSLDEAFGYLHRAMTERHKDPTNVICKPHSPLPTLDGVVESQTLEELQARGMDDHTFRLECLAIVDRVLGPDSPDSCSVYERFRRDLHANGFFETATALSIHVTKAPNCCREEVLRRFGFFLEDFDVLLRNGLSPPISLVEEVAKLILEKLQQDPSNVLHNGSLVSKWLKCILVGLYVTQDQESRRGLQLLGENLVHICPPIPKGLSVVHMALVIVGDEDPLLEEELDVPYHNAASYRLPYDLLVPFLIQCGADVNAMANNGNRPLHIITVKLDTEDDSERLCNLTRTLVEAGALVGVQNRVGRTPLDCAYSKDVADTLREYLPPPLQSLAASAIIKHNIPYEASVPDVLKEFIQLHSTGKD